MSVFKFMGDFFKRLIKSFSMSKSMVFVYITCKDKKEARKISRHLLESNLVACTNSFPIESSYKWKGKIVDDSEHLILAKTNREKYPKIESEVKKIHSYDIPCICLLESQDNKEFLNWMNGELK